MGERELASTYPLKFEDIRDRFVERMPKGSAILDFGCRSGRDTIFFTKKELRVTPVESSKVLCNIATKNTGIRVRHMMYNELRETGKYDGIWTSSAIHHLTYNQLVDVFARACRALKPNGIFYVSFNYGVFEGVRNGRNVTDMNEDKIKQVLGKVKGLVVEEMTLISDTRPDRGKQLWLHIFLRKND